MAGRLSRLAPASSHDPHVSLSSALDSQDCAALSSSMMSVMRIELRFSRCPG